jgi:hypothetical protein
MLMASAYGIVRSTVRLEKDPIHSCMLMSVAPIVKDVGVTYSPVKFHGSLLKSNNFRLDAGPEVDAAWKSLGADCSSQHLRYFSPLMLTFWTRFCGEDTSTRSTTLRSCARSGQDQRGVWWWLSSARRGLASSSLLGRLVGNYGLNLVDKWTESAA